MYFGKRKYLKNYKIKIFEYAQKTFEILTQKITNLF